MSENNHFKSEEISPASNVKLPLGFEFNGISSNIKPSGKKDMAIVKTDDNLPVYTLGVFTTNETKAAPVIFSKKSLEDSNNMISAVLLNSGNANAATGPNGLKVSESSANLVAKQLGCKSENILVCSTGLIGIPMPLDPFVASVPTLVGGSSNDIVAFNQAAEAILTTDTVKKTFIKSSTVDGYSIAGFAKGAAMLAPSMATMLSVIVTDAIIDKKLLGESFLSGIQDSFNSIVVDGCMSTNDTVILMTSAKKVCSDPEEFSLLLKDGLLHLAHQMVKDAEGGTVVAKLNIMRAKNQIQAKALASKVAQSVLVRCSLNGRDPYWGRIISELGAAKVNIDPNKVSISYGDIMVAKSGCAIDCDEEKLKAYMLNNEIEINVDINLGNDNYTMFFSDISHDYIDENIKTS